MHAARIGLADVSSTEDHLNAMTSADTRRRARVRSVRIWFLSIAMLAVVPAFSQTVYSYTGLLSQVSIQMVSGSSNGANWQLVPAGTLSESCPYGVIFIVAGTVTTQPVSAATSAMYATSLAAFASGQQVVLNYTFSGSGTGNLCIASYVAII
jgi:hypothetical protein